MSRVFIDSFSAGLDDLSRGQQGDRKAVLHVLHKAKRFSVFEATATDTIARTMTGLFRDKLVEEVGKAGYPWTNVRLTPAGLALIDAASTKGAAA